MAGFDDQDDGPDLNVVVAEYREAMRKRLRWIFPAVLLILVAVGVWTGTYSVEPGQVGVVRTFGKESGQTQPGLHFVVPIAQRVDIVDLAKIRRTEIGFRGTPNGPKLVPAEAQMLTGDENIVEVQMIVQYRVSDPSKYLFKLKDPEESLHIAAEVALRDVVGQMRVTSSIEELNVGREGAPEDDSDEDDDPNAKTPPPPPPKKAPNPRTADEETDILTKGRERAQTRTKALLQKLLDLYESGLTVTVVKLRPVDVPDEVKDAFHDVVRAREEREQKINKALAYREDRIPRARGEAQKVVREAEAYKKERVLRAEGEAARFRAVLAEYRKARGVTRERLHLETIERILERVNKVFIDDAVAKGSVPILPLGGSIPGLGGAKGGAK